MVNKSNISELTIEEKEFKITIKQKEDKYITAPMQVAQPMAMQSPAPQAAMQAPVAAAAAGGAAGGAADAAQDEFTIILEDAGSQKIAVIKEVRALNSSLGLKEAKDLVDATPATIMEKADKATADKAKAAFEAAGAKVTIK